MDDMERYGDYNEVDEPPRRSPVTLVIKLLVALVCISVAGVLGFRIAVFNHYPDSIKSLYIDEKLTELYKATDGEIGALTQSLRSPYDDPDRGNFFCDNLIFIDAIDRLQISVRYNVSALSDIEEFYKTEGLDPDSDKLFSFRLVDNYGRVYDEVADITFDSYLMYRYLRLTFDGVVTEPDAEGKFPEWIRLEIFVEGHSEENKPYAMIPVYENHADYNVFDPYVLSGEEVELLDK